MSVILTLNYPNSELTALLKLLQKGDLQIQILYCPIPIVYKMNYNHGCTHTVIQNNYTSTFYLLKYNFYILLVTDANALGNYTLI